MRQHGRMEGLTFTTGNGGLLVPWQNYFLGLARKGFWLSGGRPGDAGRQRTRGGSVVNRVLPGDGEVPDCAEKVWIIKMESRWQKPLPPAGLAQKSSNMGGTFVGQFWHTRAIPRNHPYPYFH